MGCRCTVQESLELTRAILESSGYNLIIRAQKIVRKWRKFGKNRFRDFDIFSSLAHSYEGKFSFSEPQTRKSTSDAPYLLLCENSKTTKKFLSILKGRKLNFIGLFLTNHNLNKVSVK